LEVWEQCKRESAKKLPPIFPIVFYHGTRKWNFPTNFNALINFSGQEDLKPFVPEYKYFLYDLTQIEELEVIGSEYLQATLLLMKNIRQADLLKRLDYIWKVLKNASQVNIVNYIVACFRYISSANIHLTADELTGIIKKEFSTSEGVIMAQLAKDWIQQGLDQGRQEGREQGRQEEAAKTSLRLIHRRIGIIPATQQDLIRNLSLDQLETLIDDLLDFNSAADLNNWIATYTSNK
jgi:predicted transposase YdaD